MVGGAVSGGAVVGRRPLGGAYTYMHTHIDTYIQKNGQLYKSTIIISALPERVGVLV